MYIVTGAPGSGKSTVLEAFLGLHSDYIAFDIDWLAKAASDLAAKDIYSEPSTWRPYSVLWFEILHAIYKNGRTPIFFTPNDPQDIEQYGRPAWCRDVKWLLLDCDDQTRRERLRQRLDWTEAMIAEAVADADMLRQAIHLQADTGLLSPNEIAAQILNWLEQSHRNG
ncbi:MAG: AAA family ATPase [Chloroflexales bacterium]|nr:AAA family ATPase [Chloroflexales bacterium]